MPSSYQSPYAASSHFSPFTGDQVDYVVGRVLNQSNLGYTLTVGSVTTIPPWVDASATITGESPDQTLNLWIPRGYDGDGSGSGGSIDVEVVKQIVDSQLTEGEYITSGGVLNTLDSGEYVNSTQASAIAAEVCGSGGGTIDVGTVRRIANQQISSGGHVVTSWMRYDGPLNLVTPTSTYLVSGGLVVNSVGVNAIANFPAVRLGGLDDFAGTAYPFVASNLVGGGVAYTYDQYDYSFDVYASGAEPDIQLYSRSLVGTWLPVSGYGGANVDHLISGVLTVVEGSESRVYSGLLAEEGSYAASSATMTVPNIDWPMPAENPFFNPDSRTSSSMAMSYLGASTTVTLDNPSFALGSGSSAASSWTGEEGAYGNYSTFISQSIAGAFAVGEGGDYIYGSNIPSGTYPTGYAQTFAGTVPFKASYLIYRGTNKFDASYDSSNPRIKNPSLLLLEHQGVTLALASGSFYTSGGEIFSAAGEAPVVISLGSHPGKYILSMCADEITLKASDTTLQISSGAILINGRKWLDQLTSVTNSTASAINFNSLPDGNIYSYLNPVSSVTIGSISSNCRAQLKFTPALDSMSFTLPPDCDFVGVSQFYEGLHYLLAISGLEVVCNTYTPRTV